MSSTSLLIFCITLVPTLLAARVWFFVTHAGEDLSGYRAYDGSAQGCD